MPRDNTTIPVKQGQPQRTYAKGKERTEKRDPSTITIADTVERHTGGGIEDDPRSTAVVPEIEARKVRISPVGLADIPLLGAMTETREQGVLFGVLDVPLPSEVLDEPFTLPPYKGEKRSDDMAVSRTAAVPQSVLAGQTKLTTNSSNSAGARVLSMIKGRENSLVSYGTLRQRYSSNDTMVVDRLALPPGYIMNEYRIDAVLGLGGFGITYLAWDMNLHTQVAIKEYLPNDLVFRDENSPIVKVKSSDEEDNYQLGLERFISESRTLASFRHPNIIRVLRFFGENNTIYMVMEYEVGESLNNWLKKRFSRKMLTLLDTDIIRMFTPLLQGLAKVHDAGFLHRDIKPANIYVRDDDSLVLLDFGAARRTLGGRSTAGITSIVTPGYAPLEQYYSHGRQGPWSDIYAMGGVLYWLVAGRKPVEAAARVHDDPQEPAVEVGCGHYAKSFLQAIDWALYPDDTKRPQNVAEFLPMFTDGQEVSNIIVQDSSTFSISIAKPRWLLIARKVLNTLKLPSSSRSVLIITSLGVLGLLCLIGYWMLD